MKEMSFESTDEDRIKILNKRYKYEKKWIGFRVFACLFRLLGIYLFLFWGYKLIFKIGNEPVNLIFFNASFIVGLLVPFFIRMIGRSTVSSWVTDIFDEKLEIKDNTIVRAYSLSLGAGYMNLFEGNDRVIMITKCSDIHNLKMCHKTGRIQFNADTRIMYYSNWKEKVLEQDYEKKDFLNVYYNYFQPDLIQYFEESQIPYVEGDMNFEKGK